MAFAISPNVSVERDAAGVVRHLHHIQEAYRGPAGTESESELATSYLRDVAELYGIDPGMQAPLVGEDAEGPGPFLELAEQKRTMETTTVSFAETFRGLPVWEAGFTVSLLANPIRVVSSWSTIHHKIDLDEPEDLGPGLTPEEATPTRVAELLGLKEERQAGRAGARRARTDVLRITRARALIYRYDPDQRIDPESRIQDERPLSSGPPTLDLPEVPERIQAGRHYLVTEVLLTLAVPDLGDVHWRAFFERHSGAALYLRAFVACADGLVYVTDPMTAAGGPLPNGPLPALNALRALTTLADLPPQVGGTPVALNGRFVQLVDFSPPPAAPPTEQFGHFLYNVNTTNFSANNAYYHLDALFQLMESMGFVVPNFFDDTSFNPGFPLPVDHWGAGGAVNAFALGNSTGTGSAGFIFGRAAAGTNVGIADDARVVAHEFCHALLFDSVNSGFFGFAHSAGDSIGAILNDPGSKAPDRFVTFPWVNIGRRHDRQVGAGWAWGGPNDTGGYQSEQILCTSHFRAYLSTGGDSSDLAMKRYGARTIVYLIIRAIGSLATSPVTPTPNVSVWVTALMNADIGTTAFDDQPGGCYIKVIRWAFEQQGLFQPPGAPPPPNVFTPGAPPPVDVYVDDGRRGGYGYAERFWHTTEVWNRHAPDSKTTHQTPIVGRRNYAYVRVRNRGTQPAGGVVVRGHHCRPATGLVWPDDWTPMTTAQIAVAGTIPPNGQVEVGPFEWIPSVSGHECLLMSVSAAGDLANNDTATFFPCATGPTPIWRLVPFDNNLTQRAVIPVPGGGGRHELAAAFEHRRFWVANPFTHTARIEILAELPPLLQARGWQVTWDGIGTSPFSLAPRDDVELHPRLLPGADFTATDVNLAGNVAIEFVELADGLVVGGLTYVLDPELTRPAREWPDEEDKNDRHERDEEHEDHSHVGGEKERTARRVRLEIDLD